VNHDRCSSMHGPPPVSSEAEPLSCDRCAVKASFPSARCSLGDSCREDRYAPRVLRFFRENPELADASLNHPYFEVRAIAVRYASVFRLAGLLHDPDETVRMSVAMRVPQRLLKELADDEDREVRIRVATRLSPPQLVLLRNDPDYYVRVLVARRIPLPLVSSFADDPDAQVRIEVASRLPPSQLARMAFDPDARVRRVVAERCEPNLFGVLSKDESFRVRWEVASRASGPILAALLDDPDPEVAARAEVRRGETT